MLAEGGCHRLVGSTAGTDDEAEKIARLIARLPELVELEKDRNKARNRRKPQPLHFKPVTVGDLISCWRCTAATLLRLLCTKSSVSNP